MFTMSIDKELVEFRFFCNLMDCIFQFFLVGSQGYRIDSPYEYVRYLVCPVAYDALYFYFHCCDNLVVYIFLYAVALILLRISLLLALTRFTICSWYSVFLLHTPRLCTTFKVCSDTSIVSIRLPSMVAERIRESSLR